MEAGPSRGWQRFHEIVEQNESFLLTSHVFPEGDSIGSEVALGLHLRDRGKTVHILNPTPARHCYEFLMGFFPIRHLGHNGSPPVPSGIDFVVAVDVGSWDYMGPLGEILRGCKLPMVSIDHHHPGKDFADLGIVDPQASSTGEMIYQYLRWSGARISPAIAQALYTSVMFDTGGLRLPQTTNETVMIAADLLRHGADHSTVARSIFQSESFERLDLYRRALGKLNREHEGKLAWLSLPNETFIETDTCLQDGDGILDSLLPVSEIEICVLFREVAGFGCRITFRSKGRHDVGSIATQLGGGGRPTAAGVFLPISLAEAEESILPIMRHLFTNTAESCSSSRAFRD
jgi:nanoRNase/pAp phosphatase (c-di-AMP/oligoRNAs hydrolase)